MKTRFLKNTFWPALLWSLLVFILLIIPGEEFPEGPEVPLFDKIIHVFLFGVLVVLWGRYFKQRGTNAVFRQLNAVFILSCVFGIAMEFVQKYFVANRGFEWGDIAADVTGALAGWVVIRFYFLKMSRV